MNIPREIHTYLIPLAMVCAFVHVVYLMIKAYKQQPMMKDLTVKEFKRVANENWKNFGKNSSLFLKPFLVFLLWTLCIVAYFILALKLGFLRQPAEEMWPRGEETFHTIPYYAPQLVVLFALVVILVVGIVLYFRKRNVKNR